MSKVGLLAAASLVALLCAAALPQAAHADLYRWVDPETGSVKFSSQPPPEGRAAEVVPFRGAAAAPERPASVLDAQAPLEQRRRLLQQVLLQTPFDATNPGVLQKQAEAYRAVSEELDKVDPAGAERRRAEDAALFQKMRTGSGAQAGAPDDPTKGSR